MKLRVTVRGQGLELRGFVAGYDTDRVAEFCEAMKPFGLVIASHVNEEFVIGEPDNTPEDYTVPSCEMRSEKGYTCTRPRHYLPPHAAGDARVIVDVWED